MIMQLIRTLVNSNDICFAVHCLVIGARLRAAAKDYSHYGLFSPLSVWFVKYQQNVKNAQP